MNHHGDMNLINSCASAFEEAGDGMINQTALAEWLIETVCDDPEWIKMHVNKMDPKYKDKFTDLLYDIEYQDDDEDDEPEFVPGLERYEEGVEPRWINAKIVVESERDKEQLLLASEYIHYLSDLDTDYIAPNWIAHIYTTPEIIEIREAK